MIWSQNVRLLYDSLDIAWLKDDSDESADGLPEPAILAQAAMGELEGAMAELRGILAELGGEVGWRRK